jgi:hypothetical protein
MEISMNCAKCNAPSPENEAYVYADQTLCEDCYLDLVAKPQACDPWAVYSAQNTSTQESDLTDTQRRILDAITAHGPLSQEEICSRLGIDSQEFAANFAVLRHMGLGRACQVNGEKRFTRFEDNG